MEMMGLAARRRDLFGDVCRADKSGVRIRKDGAGRS